jgi:hypothetical protein
LLEPIATLYVLSPLDLPGVLAAIFSELLANFVHGDWKVRAAKDRRVRNARHSLRGIAALSL